MALDMRKNTLTKIIKSKFQITGILSKFKILTFRQDGHHPGTLVLMCDNFCTIPVSHLRDLVSDMNLPSQFAIKSQPKNCPNFTKIANFDIITI